MKMYFEEMATFAAISRHGSMTGAAGELRISKAHVSQQLSRLEEHMQTKLINRTTRKLSLTESGRALLPYCNEILSTMTQAKSHLQSLQGEVRGRLSISCSGSFGKIVVSRILRDFQETYPEIEVNLDINDKLVNLTDQNIDLVFRSRRVLDPDLVALPLVQVRQIIVASPEYLEKHGTPTHPDDLDNHNCVGFEPELRKHGWEFMIDGKIVRKQVDGNFKVNNNGVIKDLALNGLGIAIIPSYEVMDELRAKKLRALLFEYAPPQRHMYLAYLYQRSLPQKIRSCIDFTRQWFIDHPDFTQEFL